MEIEMVKVYIKKFERSIDDRRIYHDVCKNPIKIALKFEFSL